MGSKNIELLELLTLKSNILRILHQNKALLKQLHQNEELPPVDIVIKFAENITPTSHAPLKWKAGFPLFGSHPPQPLFEEMRCGALEAYNSTTKKNQLNKIKANEEDCEAIDNNRKRLRESNDDT